MKELKKTQSLRKYIDEELEIDALQRLTKEELIERYIYRIDRTFGTGMLLGCVIGIVIGILLIV